MKSTNNIRLDYNRLNQHLNLAGLHWGVLNKAQCGSVGACELHVTPRTTQLLMASGMAASVCLINCKCSFSFKLQFQARAKPTVVAGCSEEASSCGYGLYTKECSVIRHIGVNPSVELF